MPQSYRRRQSFLPVPMAVNTAIPKNKKRVRTKEFWRDWRYLQSICPDPDSQKRLEWLDRQFAKGERGASESAQAEIDIATLLEKSGYSISFVKETENRTADLECYYGGDRMFVEVTVIVPMEPDRMKVSGLRRVSLHPDEGETSDFLQDGLVKRLLARMKEKAVQLADYCAPVLLAITIAHQEQACSANGSKNTRKLALDLHQLGGVITASMTDAPQLSGTLVTLWNIQPAESRSGIRLSNVYLGEWVPGNQGCFSQNRLLALNPAARYPLEQDPGVAIQRVL